MKMLFRAALALSALLASAPALPGTVTLPQVNNAAGNKVAAGASILIDTTGTSYGANNPFPFSMVVLAATSVPQLGSVTAMTAIATSGTASFSAGVATIGPLAPQLGRTIWVTLTGTWSGSVQLLRSTDGGVTKLPLTYSDGTPKPAWTTPLNAPVAEESVSGATYYLAATLSSGSLGYRMEQ